jgi:hypothetical protein
VVAIVIISNDRGRAIFRNREEAEPGVDGGCMVEGAGDVAVEGDMEQSFFIEDKLVVEEGVVRP